MTERSQPSRAATPRRLSALVFAFAFGVIGVAAWLYKRPTAVDAPLPGPQVAASQAASSAAPAEPVLAASMAASAAPAQAAAARASAPDYSALAKKAMDQANSPAEALRKVQVALGGGTPKEALEAAQTLQMCSMMAGAPAAMYAMRDNPSATPEPLREPLEKVMEMAGGVNKVIESAEGQARRCQVFDAATLGRSMELFKRAYEGGAEGAVSAYLSALQNPWAKEKADPALIAKLRSELRTEAAGGDTAALQTLYSATGQQARDLGVTPVQQAGYKEAWRTIVDMQFPGIGMSKIIENATAPFTQAASAPPLSAADQAAANALAQQVVETWRRKRKGG